jgi:hypothetical protein
MYFLLAKLSQTFAQKIALNKNSKITNKKNHFPDKTLEEIDSLV